jgi:PAS domain-containing protein
LTADGTLLDKAIDGVKGLSLPACIKDSALRYFFVNDAYCRLMRRPAEDLIGWGSYQLTGIIEDVEREDKERRALVFGSEEAIACRIDGSPTQHRLYCERFVTEDDAIYLYEVFEEQQVTKADQDWQRREQELIDAKSARDALIAEQESLLQSLPFGVLLLNRERIFEYVNDAFYALWDVDRKINLKG